MRGFRGNEVLVNGVIRPKLTVPAGLVRLRILNASNARMYDFGFTDGRRFHQVASDGGDALGHDVRRVDVADVDRLVAGIDA